VTSVCVSRWGGRSAAWDTAWEPLDCCFGSTDLVRFDLCVASRLRFPTGPSSESLICGQLPQSGGPEGKAHAYLAPLGVASTYAGRECPEFSRPSEQGRWKCASEIHPSLLTPGLRLSFCCWVEALSPVRAFRKLDTHVGLRKPSIFSHAFILRKIYNE
jgi:hypothetical protein